MESGALAILIISFFVAFLLELFGLFGTLIVLAGSVAYGFMTEFQVLTLPFLFFLLGLYVFGEILEYLLVALGVKALGGSRRAAIWAVLGGLLGAFLGFFAFSSVFNSSNATLAISHNEL